MSIVLGVLGFFVAAAIVLIIASVLEVSPFVALLIIGAVIVVIIVILALISNACDSKKLKKAKNSGEWAFPTHILLGKCAANGVVDVSYEDQFQKAQNFVMATLKANEIPEEFHEQYTTKEAITGYFEAIKNSPDYTESELVKKLNTFYQECTAGNAIPPMNEGKLEKANLIAKRYFTDYNLDALFGEAKRLEDVRANAARVAGENEERKAQEELIKYANLHGREKTLTMLKDQYAVHHKELEKLYSQMEANAKLHGLQWKKEKSWGLAGGIAEGIAGPAAGLAAAIDVQNYNAEAREHNAKITERAGTIAAFLQGKISQKEGHLKHLQTLYEKTETLLVRDQNRSVCFKKLTFDEPKITISQWGTATIEVGVEAKSYTIYDDRPANIDGTIIAHLYDGETEVGQAEMVFPLHGSGSGKGKLKGMALTCCEQGKTYRVEFSAKDLWAIEKL